VDELTARSVAVAWRKAGRRLGLSGPGLLAGLQLDGCIGSFVVRVEQPEDRTRIVVHDERPSALSSLRWRAGAAGTTTDAVATGDAPFDDRVVASGDPVVVAAFFDASMRRRILRATTGGGRFEDGILTLDLPSPPRSATDLVSAVRRAIGFARRMSTPRDVAARLAANAHGDPVAAVRLNCLERLHESFPGRAIRVLRAALRDPDPEVRLRAATRAPEEGRRVLLALAWGFRLDEAVQARAIAALVHPPAPALIRILDTAIRRGRRRVALEAVSALGRGGSRSALAPLSRLTRGTDAAIRVAAIRALGATRQPSAQVALVSALRLEPGEAREAAAEGLGALGTVTAVAPLREAVDAYPRDAELRRAASRAIAAIQGRATGADAGQLSIVDEPGAGALSLTGSEAGQLSLGPEAAPDGPPGCTSPGARRTSRRRS